VPNVGFSSISLVPECGLFSFVYRVLEAKKGSRDYKGRETLDKLLDIVVDWTYLGQVALDKILSLIIIR